jgi:hypothetical protein
VLGLYDAAVAAPFGDAELRREGAVGPVEYEPERPVIHDLELRRCRRRVRVPLEVEREIRCDLLVVEHVFEGEAYVLHGDRLAVGPPEALAHVEGEGGVVAVHLPVLDDVPLGTLRKLEPARGPDEGLVQSDEDDRVPRRRFLAESQLAAVLARHHGDEFGRDQLPRLHDVRLFGQSLLDGRKIPGLDPLGEHRGLPVFGRRARDAEPLGLPTASRLLSLLVTAAGDGY